MVACLTESVRLHEVWRVPFPASTVRKERRKEEARLMCTPGDHNTREAESGGSAFKESLDSMKPCL